MTALAHPVIPESTARIWSQLGLGDIRKFALSDLKWGQLPLGTKLGAIEPVFPRADKSAVERMQKMEDQGRRTAVEEAKASGRCTDCTEHCDCCPGCKSRAAAVPDGKISIDDFAKVELRVGQVKVAERVKGADKLLRLEVDLGTEVRQVVAGIAEAYAPGNAGWTQSCDRRQPGSAQAARVGIKRDDRGRISRRRQTGAGKFSGRCAGGDEAEVS